MGEMGSRGRAWQLSPGRGDDIGGAAEFPVRGGASTVGAVKKATGRGVLPVGCFGRRMEEGKRNEARWHRAVSF
jgi:hypothetical protein